MKSVAIPADCGESAVTELYPSDGVDSLQPPDLEQNVVQEESEESSLSIPLHPLGVKPSGNAYTATSNAKHCTSYFQILPDEVLAILLEFLDSLELRMLGSTCKAFYAFCRSDDLWKSLFIESPLSKSGSFTWQGTWRSTHLQLQPDMLSNVNCSTVFSDALYRPFLCAHTPLKPYTINIPTSNAITRLTNLTSDEFTQSWSSKPFVLTEPVLSWPSFKAWDTTHLLSQYGNIKFRAESVDWTLETYIRYMTSTSDESPLYLFDRDFTTKMNLPVSPAAYTPPSCFGTDLFSVLGSSRPDDKWLILGPSRSGSTYHKDPNATSAWNAVLSGQKYWILFPSTCSSPPPPGVYVSEDHSEVTSPLSIAEWLLGYHAEARRTPGCIEGICSAGEVLHVPSGWWHLVVNLSPSLAITQNFVPEAHLPDVLAFLRDKPEQVSGFKKEVGGPYALFVDKMRKIYPEVLADAEKKLEGRKRKWDVAVGNEDGESGVSFSFGFGEESDEDVP